MTKETKEKTSVYACMYIRMDVCIYFPKKRRRMFKIRESTNKFVK